MLVILPPAQYDHAPIRPVPEIRMDWAEVDGYCREHGIVAPSRLTGYRLTACTVRSGTWFTIILPNDGDVSADDIDRLRRHEDGHVNGWPADHPDGRI